jgi:hypothetical protein
MERMTPAKAANKNKTAAILSFWFMVAVPTVPAKQLFITDPRVTSSRNAQDLGPWGFIGVTRKLSSDTSDSGTERWIRHWLSEWNRVSDTNGLGITPRPSKILLLNYWPWSAGKPVWSTSPFRLMAIAFRLDLRSAEIPAGEGRMIYTLTDPWRSTPENLQVIFEYALPTKRWPLREWVRRIRGLGELPFGETYLQQLRELTDEFTGNSSALRAVRTNDFVLSIPWELRNFERDPNTGFLTQTTTPQTPHLDFNESRKHELIEWIRDHSDEIQSGTYVLPAEFRTSAAPVPEESFRWLENAGLPEALRRRFSVQTCNGCHSADTGARFTHVSRPHRGELPHLSRYLESELRLRAHDLDRLNVSIESAPPARAPEHPAFESIRRSAPQPDRPH